MPIYTAYFRTDANWAFKCLAAETPREALTRAHAFFEEQNDELRFQEYEGGRPVNEIEVWGPDGQQLVIWRD
jgi:hypothetical protein